MEKAGHRWTGTEMPSRLCLPTASPIGCAHCPEMWEMVVAVFTGFQVTTQGLGMQKDFSGDWSSNHSEEMALEMW